jgi:hypothetical protein
MTDRPDAGLRMPLLVGTAAAALYLSTLSRWYSADGLYTAIALEAGDWPRLFDPYHLLLHPLAWVYWRGWQLLGWQGPAIVPVQTLDAFGAALAVGCIVRLAGRVTRRPLLAALVGAGCAVSGGVWMYATEAELATVPLGVNLFILDRALGPAHRDGSSDNGLSSGVLTGLAIALYLTSAALIPAALVALWRGEASAWRRAAARFAAGVLLALAPVALLLLLLAATMPAWSPVPPPSATLDSYLAFSPLDVLHGAYAFLRALVLYPTIGINDRTSAMLAAATPAERTLFGLWYAVVAVLAVAPPVNLMVRRAVALATTAGAGRVLGVVALWAVPCSLFAIWWVPGELEFWLPAVALWWLSAAAALARDAPRRAVAVAGAVAALLAVANATAVILPHRDAARNRPYQIAMQAVARAPASDLLMVEGGVYPFAVHFGRRPVLQWSRDVSFDALARSGLAAARIAGGRLVLVGVPPESAAARWQLTPLGHAVDQPLWQVEHREYRPAAPEPLALTRPRLPSAGPARSPTPPARLSHMAYRLWSERSLGPQAMGHKPYANRGLVVQRPSRSADRAQLGTRELSHTRVNNAGRSDHDITKIRQHDVLRTDQDPQSECRVVVLS